jgi:hypothetical protein
MRFQELGYSALVSALYGMGKSWTDLRDALGSYEGSSFVASRAGFRWRSHPEASLSNFLYARGIEHRPGTRYDDEYATMSGRNYGYYDLHFREKHGNWISVEIWGDKPMGHDAEEYATKRAVKEEFHAGRTDFLGIEFRDCYSDTRLAAILASYIGVIEPYVFDKPTDPVIQSTHWSNADELLEYCRHIAASQTDGAFPTESWLRKRGKHEKRDGDTYNTLAIYCRTWLGGVRNVRKLLGQEHNSTTAWTRESALDALREWYMDHDKSPGSVLALHRRGKLALPDLERIRAVRLRAAITAHVGSMATACDQIGVRPTRRYGDEDERGPLLERRRALRSDAMLRSR